MAGQIFGLLKQRTSQHAIADQSVNRVERFIFDEGHTAQRLERDSGYDLLLSTYDKQCYVEPGMVNLQLKATETLQLVGPDYAFDLDVRDYNLWMLEQVPVSLVLFDAARNRASWLHFQGPFREEGARRPKRGAKPVRAHVPARQVANRQAIAKMRNLKQGARRPVREEPRIAPTRPTGNWTGRPRSG